MKLTRFIKSIRWAAVGLAMLLGPPVRAQWEANFTGQVTDITDPDGIFQGLITAGTPVSGHYTYDPSGPTFNVPGVYSLTLGSVTVTNYFDLLIYSIHDEPWFTGDLFHFEAYTIHPSQYKPLPEREFLDGTTVIELADAEGTSLTGEQLLDLPVGNSWLSGFETQSAEFQVTSFNPETFQYEILASARFTFTSYETMLATPMLYPTQLYVYTTETNGSVSVTVKRAGDASGPASVDYTTVDGTGVAGTDYVAASGTLTFAPGVKSQSFTVTLLDDALQDGSKDFSVAFNNVTGAAATVPSVTVNISDDEPPLPYLSIGDFNGGIKAIETSGVATVVVWRSGEDLSKPSSVDYVTSDGTAVAGEDYIPTSGTLTFAAGETNKSFAITLVKNSVSEGQEQFFVNFSNVKDAQMGLLTGTVTIYDPAPVTVDPTFDPGAGADGPVYDLFPVINSQEQNSPATLKRAIGKILAMGDFSKIGEVSRKFLARLNDNGTTDPTFTAGGGAGDLDKAPFRLLQLPGGLLLIAGEFTTVGGEAQSYLARLKADGSFDKTFRPIINGPVYSMARQEDGMILIGGDFTEVNGTSRQHVARLNPNGKVDKTFDVGSGPDSPVFAFGIEPDGEILVGGYFENFSGSPRQLVARLSANGALDPSYSLTFTFQGSPAFGGLATKFIVGPDGSHYLVFRGFATEVNGLHSPHLALINADGTVNTGFKLNLGGIQTFALNPNAVELLSDGRLITACAADWFTQTTSESAALMRLLPNGAADPTLDPFNFVGGFGPPSDNLQMWEVAVQPDGKYLIAGTFTDVAGVPRKGMARIIVP